MKANFYAVLFVFFLLGCKKTVIENDTPDPVPWKNLAEVKAEMMRKLIIIANASPEFKKTVEIECLKQVRGDYNVSFDRLLEVDAQTSIIPASEKQVFKNLVSSMKAFRPGEMPIIFVPVMESRDPKNISPGMTRFTRSIARTASHKPANPKNYVIMVDQDNQVLPGPQKTADTAIPGQTGLAKRVNLMPDPGGDDPGGGRKQWWLFNPLLLPWIHH